LLTESRVLPAELRGCMTINIEQSSVLNVCIIRRLN
jgi:hypothetical protein